MGILNLILEFLDSSPEEPLDQIDLILPTETTSSMFSDFYGDSISRLVKHSGEKASDVANNMYIEPRTFGYIRSKIDKRHRHITFWETLRFIVVIDLPINDGLNLLHLCGYCLCRQRVRDKIIYLTLNAKNTSVFEMNARLDVLFALEYNEPLNSNRYNYRALFEHVKKNNYVED